MKAEGDVRVVENHNSVDVSQQAHYKATATTIVRTSGGSAFVQSRGRAEPASANAASSSAAGVTLTPT